MVMGLSAVISVVGVVTMAIGTVVDLVVVATVRVVEVVVGGNVIVQPALTQSRTTTVAHAAARIRRCSSDVIETPRQHASYPVGYS